MNDAELDKKLKQGRDEAERFFAAAAVLRENRAAASRAPSIPGSPKSRAFWGVARPRGRLRMAGALALAALVVAAALFAVGALRSGTAYTADGSAKNQTVCLGEDRQYRVSSIPVNMPEDGGLITVLWEMHGGSADEMAYYSLFEACDVAYPAQTILFPGTGDGMLLIASADSRAGSLGYRLVGYSGGALTDWWAEDSVQDGSVTLQEGVVVERRLQPSVGFEAVTYIVPVQSAEPGEVELPVESLHMNVGERLLLIGAEGLDLTSECGHLKKQGQPDKAGVTAVLMRATSAGSDVLHVGADDTDRTLSVDIE